MASERVFLTTFMFIFIGIVWNCESVECRRGCSSFGHSCYGGMGKRFEPFDSNEEYNLDMKKTAYFPKGTNYNVPLMDIVNSKLPLIDYKKIVADENKRINNFLKYLIAKYNDRKEG